MTDSSAAHAALISDPVIRVTVDDRKMDDVTICEHDVVKKCQSIAIQKRVDDT